MKRATELEWLKWFFQSTDFGPADYDVKYYMREAFIKETGKQLPEGYAYCLECESFEEYCECKKDEVERRVQERLGDMERRMTDE